LEEQHNAVVRSVMAAHAWELSRHFNRDGSTEVMYNEGMAIFKDME
jgi:hypothetical protein